MIHIGSHTLPSQALLAPMAGVTDVPFRQLCQQYGAGLTTSEMLIADTELWQSRKSTQRLQTVAHQTLPNSMQIVGYDPDMLCQAAVAAVAHGAEIVDINMGFPAKKVCKRAAGAALSAARRGHLRAPRRGAVGAAQSSTWRMGTDISGGASPPPV